MNITPWTMLHYFNPGSLSCRNALLSVTDDRSTEGILPSEAAATQDFANFHMLSVAPT